MHWQVVQGCLVAVLLGGAVGKHWLCWMLWCGLRCFEKQQKDNQCLQKLCAHTFQICKTLVRSAIAGPNSTYLERLQMCAHTSSGRLLLHR